MEEQDQGILDGLRVAWSTAVGGLDVGPGVRAVLGERAIPELTAGGAIITEHDLTYELKGIDEAFRALRAHGYAASFGAAVAENPDILAPELVVSTRWGPGLAAAGIARAEALRVQALERMCET